MSDKEFTKKVHEYFDGISKTVNAEERFDTGEKTQKGEPVYGTRYALNDNGEPITLRHWFSPPGEAGLCLYLGITRKQLEEYASEPKYSEALSYAELMCELYTEQIMHDGKNLSGIIACLEKGGIHTNTDGGERELSLEEKAKILRSAMDALL